MDVIYMTFTCTSELFLQYHISLAFGLTLHPVMGANQETTCIWPLMATRNLKK